MHRKIINLTLLLVSLFCRLQSECYSEYWQKFFWTQWENDSFALGTYVKLETGNHFKNIRSMQFNEQLQWKTSKNFSLELHYAYLHNRSIVPNSSWRWQHRLELEANPKFELPCNYQIETRNRLEIRKVKNEPKTLYRFRQKTMLVLPFENAGSLKSLSMYNEIFYNISTNRFTQERVCPCQLTLAISDKMELDIFLLVRFFTTDDIWQKSAVIGTQLTF